MTKSELLKLNKPELQKEAVKLKNELVKAKAVNTRDKRDLNTLSSKLKTEENVNKGLRKELASKDDAISNHISTTVALRNSRDKAYDESSVLSKQFALYKSNVHEFYQIPWYRRMFISKENAKSYFRSGKFL